MDLFTRKFDTSNLESARNYLSLLWDLPTAAERVHELRKKGQIVDRRVNDIVRAAGGVPWPWDDPGVKRELMKALSGEKLHPPAILLEEIGLVIADGSHRVSFAYHVDPFMTIPIFTLLA